MDHHGTGDWHAQDLTKGVSEGQKALLNATSDLVLVVVS
jgi:hypothetical protein